MRRDLESGQFRCSAAIQRSAGMAALVLKLAASLPACARPADSSAAAPLHQSTQGRASTKEYATSASTSQSESLLLQGYNYTDHYIDSFSVNGQGGGNIFESSPTSGGGGSVCCVAWRPGSKLPMKINVRWVADYCMYTETNQYGRSHDWRRSLWKQQDTLITEAVTEKPRALEIHFYKDGRIEAAVTQGDSPPRVKLQRDDNRNRSGVKQIFARCSDDKK